MIRKNLAKLIPQINMFNFHCTENDPEYKYLDPILSDEEVDALLKLKVRTPTYIADFAKKLVKVLKAQISWSNA